LSRNTRILNRNTRILNDENTRILSSRNTRISWDDDASARKRWSRNNFTFFDRAKALIIDFLTLTTSLINRCDCGSNRCEFELTTTLRSHDNRSQFDWFWWDEAQFEWFDEVKCESKKKVVSRISLLCAHANSYLISIMFLTT
jgi:hypothetical protein